LLSGPSILMVTALLLFPVLYAVWGSLFDADTIGGPQYFVGLDQYVELFQDPDFLWSVSRTLIFVTGVLVIGIPLGLAFAFALSRATGKLRFMRGITIVPYLISGIATAVIFRLILNRDFGEVNRVLGLFGIKDLAWFSNPTLAMLASILAQVWSDLPLVILLLLGGLMTVDRELLDAADVDGATGWKRAWRISIPLIIPQLALATILLSYQALTSLGVIIALTGGGPVDATRTMPIALYDAAFIDLETNKALAIVVVILVFNSLLTLGYWGLSRRHDLEAT
ncbi:MAG TPA: sugar ABC transporter permease, partial [Acidimicrobiia bacterium]|nr:sugar ABC transporter permease [Acidimicrobiia bacterium]